MLKILSQISYPAIVIQIQIAWHLTGVASYVRNHLLLHAPKVNETCLNLFISTDTITVVTNKK